MAMLFVNDLFYGIYYIPEMIKMMKFLADYQAGLEFYYKRIDIILN